MAKGRFNMADPAKLSPAMQFSIRCVKAEAQRDALLAAAEAVLKAWDADLLITDDMVALRIAIQQAREVSK